MLVNGKNMIQVINSAEVVDMPLFSRCLLLKFLSASAEDIENRMLEESCVESIVDIN
jgi:hypothetical protein